MGAVQVHQSFNKLRDVGTHWVHVKVTDCTPVPHPDHTLTAQIACDRVHRQVAVFGERCHAVLWVHEEGYGRLAGLAGTVEGEGEGWHL